MNDVSLLSRYVYVSRRPSV